MRAHETVQETAAPRECRRHPPAEPHQRVLRLSKIEAGKLDLSPSLSIRLGRKAIGTAWFNRGYLKGQPVNRRVNRFTNFHREGKGARKILSTLCRTTA
jgi:hypothetical protein